MKTIIRYIVASVALGVLLLATASASAEKKRISIEDGQWHLNGGLMYPGTPAEGLLMNVRMVNAVFEDKYGASWGFMHEKINQHFPFHFKGSEDDTPVYAGLRQLTTLSSDRDDAAEEKNYFPPPESGGGWRRLDKPDEIRRIAGIPPMGWVCRRAIWRELRIACFTAAAGKTNR